jgi:hypothetical protein
MLSAKIVNCEYGICCTVLKHVFCNTVHHVAEQSGINCAVLRRLCGWVVLQSQHCNSTAELVGSSSRLPRLIRLYLVVVFCVLSMHAIHAWTAHLGHLHHASLPVVVTALPNWLASSQSVADNNWLLGSRGLHHVLPNRALRWVYLDKNCMRESLFTSAWLGSYTGNLARLGSQWQAHWARKSHHHPRSYT